MPTFSGTHLGRKTRAGGNIFEDKITKPCFTKWWVQINYKLPLYIKRRRQIVLKSSKMIHVTTKLYVPRRTAAINIYSIRLKQFYIVEH
jgi:hypothetical protein